MRKADRIYRMLGLAAKAGRTASGGLPAEKAVKSGKARLVLIAEDASEGTAKKMTDMCAFRNVPVIRFGTMEELGRSIGREQRACAVVLDEGFAKALKELITAQMQTEAGTWQD